MGFETYVKNDAVAHVRDTELDEVYDYIKKHLQGEIGRWTESEVESQVKNWRIEKSFQPQPQPAPAGGQTDTAGGFGSGSWTSGGQGGFGGNSTASTKEKAKKKLNETDAESIKRAIERLCESENDLIIETILKYV